MQLKDQKIDGQKIAMQCITGKIMQKHKKLALVISLTACSLLSFSAAAQNYLPPGKVVAPDQLIIKSVNGKGQTVYSDYVVDDTKIKKTFEKGSFNPTPSLIERTPPAAESGAIEAPAVSGQAKVVEANDKKIKADDQSKTAKATDDKVKQAAEDEEQRKIEEENKKITEANAKIKKKNCEISKNEIALINSGKKMSKAGPSGESIVLDEIEVRQKKIEAEAAIKEYCD